MVEYSIARMRKINAKKHHLEVKKKFPEHADRARDTIIHFLKKYNPEKLKVYLGEEKGPPYIYGHSMERDFMAILQEHICEWFQECKENKMPLPEWEPEEMDDLYRRYHIHMEHHIRKWLQLPFKVIKGNGSKI